MIFRPAYRDLGMSNVRNFVFCVIAVIGLSPALASAFEEFSRDRATLQHCHSQDDQDAGPSTGGDHCSTLHACCHVTSLPEHPLITAPSPVRVFSRGAPDRFAGPPDLDGPFQPPKA